MNKDYNVETIDYVVNMEYYLRIFITGNSFGTSYRESIMA